MDDPACEISATASPGERLGNRLALRKEALRTQFSARRARLRELQAALAGRVAQAAEISAADEQGMASAAAALAQQSAELAQRETTLREREESIFTRIAELGTERDAGDTRTQEVIERQKSLLDQIAAGLAEIETRRDEHVRTAQTLEERETELKRRQAELAQYEQKLAALAAEHAAREAGLTAAHSELESAQADLREASAAAERQIAQAQEQLAETLAERQRLTVRERVTEKQRRHLAQQLRTKRKELLAEIELHRAEALSSSAGQQVQLQMRLTELQSKYERLRDEAAQREHHAEELQRQSGENQQRLQQAQTELRRARDEALQLSARGKQTEAELVNLQHELATIQEMYRSEEAQRLAVQAQFDRMKGEWTQRLAERDRQAQELRQRLADAESRTHELELRAETAAPPEAAQELLRASRQRDDLAQRLEQLQRAQEAERADWEDRLAAVQRGSDVSPQLIAEANGLRDQLRKLSEENKQLEQWVHEHESQPGAAANAEQLSELQRRLELAIKEVRELKNRNGELTEQLAAARSAAPKGDVSGSKTGGGAQDWESRKKQLLEQLESDYDPQDKKDCEQKLTAERVIAETDAVVAEMRRELLDKNEEIAELKVLLQNQSNNIGGMAVGAAAIAGMFDSDELIVQERTNLRQLQDQLQEQLRQAEIDISVERAKLARERAELEERFRQYEAAKGVAAPAADSSGTDKNTKGQQRKWFARLGLGDGK